MYESLINSLNNGNIMEINTLTVFRIKLKNLSSFLKYGFHYRQIRLAVFLVDLFFLLAFIISFINDNLFLGISVPIILLSIFFVISLIRELYGTLSQFHNYFSHILVEESDVDIDFDKLKVTGEEENLHYRSIVQTRSPSLNVQDVQVAFTSDSLNVYLQKHSQLDCDINNAKQKRTQDYISRNKELIFIFLKKHWRDSKYRYVYFYNEKKLCLAKSLRENQTVYFCEGRYYNTYLTNQIHFKKLTGDRIEPWFSPLYHRYLDTIPSVSVSPMSDEIGVSSLGITKNGYLVIVTQGLKANSSNGLLVPTGSGSADWTDYDNEGKDFYQTIINATNRELSEELGLKLVKDSSIRTKVIGYFRWLNRGGKPEFVSISFLDMDEDQIYPELKELKDQSGIRQLVCFDFGEKRICGDNIEKELAKFLNCPECSFPLFMNINIFLEYYHNYPGDFEKFLFG